MENEDHKLLNKTKDTIRCAELAGKLKQIADELEWYKSIRGMCFSKENLIILNQREAILLDRANIISKELKVFVKE